MKVFIESEEKVAGKHGVVVRVGEYVYGSVVWSVFFISGLLLMLP